LEASEKQPPSGTVPLGPRPWPLAAPAEQADHGPTEEERALVARARAGDKDALRELLEQHQHRIYRLAMRVLHCDPGTAEDVCQEVFLRAFRGLGRFDGQVRFGTWLHTIAMNTAITEYRRKRALKRNKTTLSIDRPFGEDDLPMDPPGREVGPAARADQREFADAVRRAVADLPEEFRHAVLLRDLQGLSYEEIAQVLNAPPGTVRSRIHRGRLLLQERLKGFV
jgi:RNA polymerase sigma-70 factor (ECF subfamily)